MGPTTTTLKRALVCTSLKTPLDEVNTQIAVIVLAKLAT
jgi:hypothetical protein